jgi:hypothetical protein
MSNATVSSGLAVVNLSTAKEGGYAGFGEPERWTKVRPWLYVNIEMRVRCTDENPLTDSATDGYKMWGLAYSVKDHPLAMIPGDGLYFEHIPPGSDPEWAGFWARIMANGSLVMSQRIDGLDIREWHIYTILWEPGNATFLIDGEVVASSQVVTSIEVVATTWMENAVLKTEEQPLRPDSGGVFKILYDCYWVRQYLEYITSLQYDYIHLFVSQERFEEIMLEVGPEMDLLLNRSQELLEYLESGGVNITRLESDQMYQANNWRTDRWLYHEAKPNLEKMIISMEHWEEINNMFAKAENAINLIEPQGNRELPVMKADLKRAKSTWEEYDYAKTENYLQNILEKAIEIPELVLSSILSLILLPVLLWRRNR